MPSAIFMYLAVGPTILSIFAFFSIVQVQFMSPVVCFNDGNNTDKKWDYALTNSDSFYTDDPQKLQHHNYAQISVFYVMIAGLLTFPPNFFILFTKMVKYLQPCDKRNEFKNTVIGAIGALSCFLASCLLMNMDLRRVKDFVWKYFRSHGEAELFPRNVTNVLMIDGIMMEKRCIVTTSPANDLFFVIVYAILQVYMFGGAAMMVYFQFGRLMRAVKAAWYTFKKACVSQNRRISPILPVHMKIKRVHVIGIDDPKNDKTSTDQPMGYLSNL